LRDPAGGVGDSFIYTVDRAGPKATRP